MSIKSEIRRYSLIGALFLSILFAISSCGGGGDGSSNPTPTASTISGTAATGNPIESAQVTVLDSTGATASGTTGTDGSFSISFSEPKPPYILKVTTSSGTTLYSVSADSETTTTINITPLTDMIIRLWYAVQNGSVEDSFTNPAAINSTKMSL